MRRVSFHQPLVVYTVVFMLLISFVVATIASFSLIQASRRAYRRPVGEQLERLAALDIKTIRQIATVQSLGSEVEIGVVTSTAGDIGVGVTFPVAQKASRDPDSVRFVVAAPIPRAPLEAYVVARIDPSIAASIALVEIGAMVKWVLLGALVCAGFLSFMIARLLLPPLNALGELARDAHLDQGGLVPDNAPNEVLEIAQRFRQTLRVLNEERTRIEAQHSELERMQASLIRASKLASVGRLAAGIAHEIGNPLAAVLGYLTLLQGNRLDDDERREILDRCSKELKRIHETIKKLLAYARKDEPKESMLPFSSAQVAHDALMLVRGHPTFSRVQVASSLGVLDEIDAHGHPSQLAQVIVNLLLNAAQALQEVEGPQVTLTRTHNETHVSIVVDDNGPGVPVDRREAIFDPFYTTKAPGEGTGLGLAVSRSLIEGMDGELLVGDAPNQGARFEIRLRRAVPTTIDTTAAVSA